MRDHVAFRLLIDLTEEFLQYSVLSFSQTVYQPGAIFLDVMRDHVSFRLIIDLLE